MAAEPTLSSLAALASETREAVDRDAASYTGSSGDEGTNSPSLRPDIIILALDARDPEGCRSRLVEEESVLLNLFGICTIPHRVLWAKIWSQETMLSSCQQWLRYLRHSTPTLSFRSASSNQRSNLSSTTAPALMRLLKAFKPSSHSITRSKACAVAAQPGHTKDLQSVQLERGIKFVDSLGVVFDEDESGDSSQKGSILLQNVVEVEDIEDLIAVVEEILARTEHEALQKLYTLPRFSMDTCSREVPLTYFQLHVTFSWTGTTKKIPTSVTPAIHPSSMPSATTGAETVAQAQILNSFSKSFELAGLFGVADAGAFNDNAQIQEEVAMDDGDVNNDITAQEFGMIVDDGMTTSTLSLPSSRKRICSPSLITQAGATDPSVQLRIPKRFRRAKDLSAYEEAAARSQGRALNRRSVKQDRRRSRRSANKLMKAELGMEVDGLQETIIADVQGRITVLSICIPWYLVLCLAL
ncbi:hypothetical protein EDB19DRAFT_1905117 [Suillus lakei]|nr:hypothetical protein EDB19DRAFT_1905117 [Suillus lakei]